MRDPSSSSPPRSFPHAGSPHAGPDALAEVLRQVRLESTVFARASLFSPWAVSTNGLDGGIFHAVVRGRCVAIPTAREGATKKGAKKAEALRPLELGPGDVVLLPYGDPHVMADRAGRRAVPIRGLVRATEPGGVGQLHIDGGGEETSLVCGRFDVARAPGPTTPEGRALRAPHPLLGLLPRVVRLRADDPALAAWLPPLVAALAQELDHPQPGASTVITRLADVLVVHAIRTAVREGTSEQGWLSALRDPRIARALDLVHTRPHEAWTAASLAEAVGMGRSAFFDRFTALVREPPAQYLARWRMQLAQRSLARGEGSVAEIGRRVGYDSEAAFSRAFKRLVGISPGLARGVS
ncbi:MAG: AraC family transcriptional regulator [Sandaracinus sp.]